MKGADGHALAIYIVIDWLGRLMLMSGRAVVFSSNATLGHLLRVWGSSIFLATFICRKWNKFPSEATRRLDFAATIYEAFGSVSFITAKYFTSNGDMSFVWLYITGNMLYFFGGLLNTVNVLEIQQMKGLQDTRKAQGTSHWILIVSVDFVGRLMLTFGNNAALFSSNASLGFLLNMWGTTIVLAIFVSRMRIKLPSAATRHLDFAAISFEAFGLVSLMVAKHLIYNGKMSFIWLYITGNILFFIGGLLNAANGYKMHQMKELQDRRNAQGMSRSHN